MTEDRDSSDGRTSSTAERPSDDRRVPLEDLARDVNDRRTQRAERADATDVEDPFEQVDVVDVDRDRLWDDLSRVDAGRAGDDAADVQLPILSPESTGDAREHVVAKRDYCEGCPHFSAPPEVRCTHGGTEIVEVVSFEEFRVRDCPVVDD
jgi:hypothetical protein